MELKKPFAITIGSNQEFIPENLGHASGHGKFEFNFIPVVEALQDEPSLRLQVSCTVRGSQLQRTQARSGRFGLVSFPCEVSMILYGPQALIDNVGEFFQNVDMYLQDPTGCDVDARYCNPHRLSSLDIQGCPMTSELGRPATELDPALFQDIPSESDVLAVLDAHQDLPEAPQPNPIRSLLKKSAKFCFRSFPFPNRVLTITGCDVIRHQRQALTFLLRREAGWNFDPKSLDFWDYDQTHPVA